MTTVTVNVRDIERWVPKWSIDRFSDPNNEIAHYLQAGGDLETAKMMVDPSEGSAFLGHSDFQPNLLLNNGITVLQQLLCGIAGPGAFSNSNARLCVGDSVIAANATQTSLQAGVNLWFQTMDGGYPTVSLQTASWRITVASGNANFSWNEFGVDNDAAGGTGSTPPTYTTLLVLLNRLVSAQGTKIAGQTWVLTLNLTIS